MVMSTGGWLRVIAMLWLLGLVPTVAVAADLTCRAEVDRRSVAPGGQIVLTLHARGDIGGQPRHQPPRIEGVEVVPGGTSQSFQLVNGKSEHSLDVTYYLVVRRDDDFQIPPLAFTAGDQTCRTEPISISVTAGARPPAGAADAPASGGRAGQPGDAYFITLTVDRDEVWVGQQMLLSFRFYHRRSAWDRPDYSAPRTEGFWRVDLPERRFRQTVGGHVYDVIEVRYALFPTRPGELVVDSARLEVPSDPFQQFLGRRSRGPVQLITDPLTITVKDLPAPRPAAFSGIVADRLAFAATVDRDTVPRGEPISLTLEVTADAFLKSFEGVRLPAPDGARLHDAAENLQEDAAGPRYQATFTQEKAVVPTREGVLDLGPLELTYFDTGQGRFLTEVADLPRLIVVSSDLPVLGDDRSGFLRTEIARLGNDLAFIHPVGRAVAGPRVLSVGQPAWWLVLVAPWLALLLFRWYLGRRAADLRDPVGVRRRQALATALKRLDAAVAAADADQLARAILGFVADRSGRPLAGLSASDVSAWARDQGDAAAGARLVAVLEACDQARFGGQGAVEVAAMAQEVRAILPKLIHRRGPRRSPATVTRSLALVALCLSSAATLAGPGPDPLRLIAEGNQAYTEGDLELALERYREARELGADAADLHYNLGNTHARRGELGHAIASYLRAERRAPRDGDIRRNLAWVRQHTRDLELAGSGLPPVIAQLDRAAHWLSVREWGHVLLVLSWLVCATLAWSWQRGRLDAPLRRVLIALAVSLVAAGSVTATRWYEEHGRPTAVVVVEEAEVRSGPAETFPVVFRIHDGLTLVVRGERDGWSRVGLGGDWVGWVPAGTLESVDQGR